MAAVIFPVPFAPTLPPQVSVASPKPRFQQNTSRVVLDGRIYTARTIDPTTVPNRDIRQVHLRVIAQLIADDIERQVRFTQEPYDWEQDDV